ncbi:MULTISPECIES: ATP synthase F1 subunit epsilon [Thermoactinomyces]|uniref:ATP synthase epsilon chain n=1 Tax=Thermoactinomyces daqus TaxID=1329516 RepID=A0A7W1X894_9BACL|nr:MULTISPECIES: ATP synthase F1 subunit epsilon [Thermoactinomyces]MBA4541834.1 ATP synthase F1 subunit epsilon [Thermoactinomyces daqus]MBH8608095.1 ATP synthase F1 subunit epsilon [Thermoactinomyces sp. CICC 10521]
MSTMVLDIVTPEKKVYSEEVEMVITKAAEGEIGILPRHIPLVSPIKGKTVRVKKDGVFETFHVSGGFIEVRSDRVTILAEKAELPGQNEE